MPKVLENELSTFDRHRDELIGKAEGKFVLIREDQVVGIFDSRADAIREGYTRFGNVPFLVKQVVKIETPKNFVSNLLAL